MHTGTDTSLLIFLRKKRVNQKEEAVEWRWHVLDMNLQRHIADSNIEGI
jgi:hypothetical protein